MVGGRAAVAEGSSKNFLVICRIIVIDVSALSSGISFPIIRSALEWADPQSLVDRELHIVLAEHSIIDHSVSALPVRQVQRNLWL